MGCHAVQSSLICHGEKNNGINQILRNILSFNRQRVFQLNEINFVDDIYLKMYFIH